MAERKRKQPGPGEAGFSVNQVADRRASLGEAWTQARSMGPVPDGDAAQFAEFWDEMPNSPTRPEALNDAFVQEELELPSTLQGREPLPGWRAQAEGETN